MKSQQGMGFFSFVKACLLENYLMPNINSRYSMMSMAFMMQQRAIYCILMEGGAWSIYLFIMNYG